MRQEESLHVFRSLKKAVDVLYLRQNHLRTEYLEQLASNLGKQVVEVDCDTPPPSTMASPYVVQLYNSKADAVKTVQIPEMVHTSGGGDMPQTFRVPAPIGHFAEQYLVTPDVLTQGKYEQACSCGACASTALFCKHVAKCIDHNRSNWHHFIKPWLTVRSWCSS